MKILNISQGITVSVFVKNEKGEDVQVFLQPDEFVFSPTNEKTKSINLQGLKRNVTAIFDEDKPEYLEYYTSYDESSLRVDATLKDNVIKSLEKEKGEVNIVSSLTREKKPEIPVNVIEPIIIEKEIESNELTSPIKEEDNVVVITKKEEENKFIIKPSVIKKEKVEVEEKKKEEVISEEQTTKKPKIVLVQAKKPVKKKNKHTR